MNPMVGEAQAIREHKGNHLVKVAWQKELRDKLRQYKSVQWMCIKHNPKLATEWLHDNLTPTPGTWLNPLSPSGWKEPLHMTNVDIQTKL
jgi:hypothetical protein